MKNLNIKELYEKYNYTIMESPYEVNNEACILIGKVCGYNIHLNYLILANITNIKYKGFINHSNSDIIPDETNHHYKYWYVNPNDIGTIWKIIPKMNINTFDK